MSQRTAEVDIGPEAPDAGITIEVVKCYLSHDDINDALYTTVTYTCHGVTDIDIQGPWEMGKDEPGSQIRLTFSTGREEYVYGVITDINA